MNDRDAVLAILAGAVVPPTGAWAWDDGFATYRDMVRRRLRRHLRSSLKRTVESAGSNEFDVWVELFLEQGRPQQRQFHLIPCEFGEWLCDRTLGSEVRQALRHELAWLQVRDAEQAELPEQLTMIDFDFEAVPYWRTPWTALEQTAANTDSLLSTAVAASSSGARWHVWWRAPEGRVQTAVWPDWLVLALQSAAAGQRTLSSALLQQWSRGDSADLQGLATTAGTLLSAPVGAGSLFSVVMQ